MIEEETTPYLNCFYTPQQIHLLLPTIEHKNFVYFDILEDRHITKKNYEILYVNVNLLLRKNIKNIPYRTHYPHSSIF